MNVACPFARCGDSADHCVCPAFVISWAWPSLFFLPFLPRGDNTFELLSWAAFTAVSFAALSLPLMALTFVPSASRCPSFPPAFCSPLKGPISHSTSASFTPTLPPWRVSGGNLLTKQTSSMQIGSPTLPSPWLPALSWALCLCPPEFCCFQRHSSNPPLFCFCSLSLQDPIVPTEEEWSNTKWIFSSPRSRCSSFLSFSLLFSELWICLNSPPLNLPVSLPGVLYFCLSFNLFMETFPQSLWISPGSALLIQDVLVGLSAVITSFSLPWLTCTHSGNREH